MMKFPYEKEHSRIFGLIRRPITRVNFWSKKFERWLEFTMIVDTGADYTLFPYSKAEDLGMDLKKECLVFQTSGIGGTERVYLFKKMKMKLGEWTGTVPVGFLARDDIPPLLGRFKCMDRFDFLFSNFTTYISSPRKSKK